MVFALLPGRPQRHLSTPICCQPPLPLASQRVTPTPTPLLILTNKMIPRGLQNPVALPRKARGHHGGIPSPKSIVRSRHQDRTPAILRGIIVDVSVVGPAQELGHGTLSKGRSGRIKLTHSRRARGPDSHIDACVSTRPVPPSATEAGRLLQPYR